MEKQTGLTIAGVLLLLVALSSFLFGGLFVFIGSSPDNPEIQDMVNETAENMGLDPDEVYDVFFNISYLMGGITLAEGFIILLGVVCIFMKRLFILPVVGSILGILNLASWSLFLLPLILSIVALYFLWKGKDLFGQKINREPRL